MRTCTEGACAWESHGVRVRRVQGIRIYCLNIMCISVYVCMRVYVYVCENVSVRARVYACVHVHMNALTCRGTYPRCRHAHAHVSQNHGICSCTHVMQSFTAKAREWWLGPGILLQTLGSRRRMRSSMALGYACVLCVRGRA